MPNENVEYYICPTEGRYAARSIDELIYNDKRIVTTDPSTWKPIYIKKGSPADVYWGNKVISKELSDEIFSVIRLTRKTFLLYELMKNNREPMTKQQWCDLGKPDICMSNVHRALTLDFSKAGITLIKIKKDKKHLYSIEIPNKPVVILSQKTSVSPNSTRVRTIIELSEQVKTLEEIGAVFNISKQRVQQILEDV